jgi:hypothetical protein
MRSSIPRDAPASTALLCAITTVLASACASSAPPPPAAALAQAPAAAPAAPPAAPPANPPAAVDAYDDPGELNDPETMTPLFGKDSRPTFPKATTTERECWQTIQISGDAKKDFDALVSKCGAPTGSVQYVAPVVGKLHYTHDKRDTFNVKIQGGLCYRFFGVADGTIQDLDILIERANGDLVGDDKTNGPVAIIDMDKNWCMDTDGDFRFKVEVDGTGTGNYAFGVWARPKK